MSTTPAFTCWKWTTSRAWAANCWSSGGRYRAKEVPADDLIAELYTEAIGFLAGHGLAQYEISNFARPDCESRHNLKYWRRQPYLGFGLDAHSMLRTHAGATLRFGTTDDFDAYLEGPGWSEPRRLDREEEMEEAWFLGLRLNEGVSLGALRAGVFCVGGARISFDHRRTGRRGPGHACSMAIAIALTAQGRLLSNEVFERFLAEPAVAKPY